MTSGEHSSGFTIRSFVESHDLEEFLALNRSTFWDSIIEEEKPSRFEFAKHHEWLMQRYKPFDPERCRIRVAVDGTGSYLGHCWMAMQNDFFTNKPTPWIFDLTVKEAARGMGVGKALLMDCADFAKELGYKKVGLQVMAHNEGAIEFYRRCGLEVSAQSMFFNVGHR